MYSSSDYYLLMNMLPGIGPIRAIYLLSHFGSPEAIFSAKVDELANVKGIGIKLAEEIVNGYKNISIEEEKRKIRKANAKIILLTDREYPMLLRAIPDPPLLLYLKGKLEVMPALSIVGSRRPTHWGKDLAYKLAYELTKLGFVIVSGLARGIDTAAHKGALAANGNTIGVLGCGIDVVYPPENKSLFDEIVEKGAIITEFPCSTPPLAENFPRRNRIISGLTLGTVVVEAGEGSGALITANHALEQGREVFAVPGFPNHPLSRGTNMLIKEGAKLTEKVDDIIEELESLLQTFSKREEKEEVGEIKSEEVKIDKKEELILAQLDKNLPLHIDILAQKVGMSIEEISVILLQLELKGKVKQLFGKRYTL
jgi:DNA processing protein